MATFSVISIGAGSWTGEPFSFLLSDVSRGVFFWVAILSVSPLEQGPGQGGLFRYLFHKVNLTMSAVSQKAARRFVHQLCAGCINVINFGFKEATF